MYNQVQDVLDSHLWFLLNPVTVAWIKFLILYYSVIHNLLISAINIHVMSGQHWHDFDGNPRSRDEDAQGSE